MKTIKSYLSKIRNIEKISPMLLKGFEKLTTEQKEAIENMSAEISNLINEFE